MLRWLGFDLMMSIEEAGNTEPGPSVNFEPQLGLGSGAGW